MSNIDEEHYITNDEGDVILYPLDIPAIDDSTEALLRQATLSMSAVSRLFNTMTFVSENIDNLPDALTHAMDDIYMQGSDALLNTLSCLLGVALNHGIDIKLAVDELAL